MANNETLEAVDDFTRIEGIGPKIRERLHKAGIDTLPELADASLSQIRALVPSFITDEKIAGWIDTAGELVQETEPVEPPQDAVARGNHQHYATFTVKLLLNEENNVRRTHITHVQGGSEDAWANWDQKRMVEFIVQHADLRVPLATPAEELPNEISTESLAIVGAVDADSSNIDTQRNTVRELIFESTVKVCAKNRQLPGANCLFEHEIINQNFEHDGKLIIGGLIRRSGDKQKNEHMRILIDNQKPPVFESFDKPGNEEETFSVEAPLSAGNHAVLVQHTDVSAKPKSAESVHVDLKVWFEFNKETPPQPPLPPPITAPPVIPKLQITAVNIKEGSCGDEAAPSNRIIGTDQDWCIRVEWVASDTTKASLFGDWILRAYLESIGPGQEYTLPTTDGVRIPLSSYASEESSGSLNTYRYIYDIGVLAGTINTGPYALVVAVTWEKNVGTPGDLAHFFEGPMLQIYAR